MYLYEVFELRPFILIGVAACTLAAQTPVPDRVTLSQAVQEAIDRNLGLLAERFNLTIADARIITARLRPNPVFSAGLDYQDMLGTGFNLQNGAGPAEFNLRIDFLLERGQKRERRIDVAQASREVAELQLLNTTRQLVLDVQNAFVDVLAAKEALTLATENLRAFEGIVEVNANRVRAGDLAQVELVRSRVAALQFQNAVRQAESRLRIASNRLQALMGRVTANPSLEVDGTLRRETPVLAVDDLRRLALELRPDLLALRRDSARSLADIRLQQAQGKVDYTVGTEYHRQYDNAHGNSMGFFFSAPLPVFNRNQGEIDRARREQEQIQMRIRAQQAAVETEVRNAWVQYTTSRDLLQSIESDLLGQAQEVRSTMEYSYRRGEASLVEFLDAQRAFNDARQSYNDARADYSRSLYLMDSISGKAVTP
jgi:outer membrane protein, heavy metal efflux system